MLVFEVVIYPIRENSDGKMLILSRMAAVGRKAWEVFENLEYHLHDKTWVYHYQQRILQQSRQSSLGVVK